jgi:hypothetical protein
MSLVGVVLVLSPPPQVLFGHGRPSVRQVADEPPEQQAAIASVATVVAEDEFVEVCAEVLVGDYSLVGSKQPALEERRHPVNVRWMTCARVLVPGSAVALAS